jgi:hypothetical protein
MPRSGTTLTEQIIASHPNAAGAGELSYIRAFSIDLGLSGENAFTDSAIAKFELLTPEGLRDLAERYLAVLAETSASALRVVDKLPVNFEHLGLIAMLFPNAKIVHCSRNPIDTCLSCFTNPLKLTTLPFAESLTALGSYYREYVRMMDHWRNVLPMPIFEANYETVTESFEEHVRNMLDFLELEWDPACLDFHRTERAVNTPSVMQVRQPIYKTSVERWRRYEKHLGPLFEALGDLVPPGSRMPAAAVEA